MLYDYLKKKSVLIIGPPRSEKLLLAEQFLIEGFKNNEAAIYIINNNFPETVIDKMKNIHGIGDFHLESGLLKIIDCYSSYIGTPKSESDIIENVSGPQALNEISIALAKLLKKNSSVVLDSGTTLLMQNPFAMIEKFFQVIIGKIKVYSSTFLILLDEGSHPAQDITVMESLTDITVNFKKDGNNKFIEVISSTASKKIPYELETGRLVFKELIEA